jgi:hypothetical protein
MAPTRIVEPSLSPTAAEATLVEEQVTPPTMEAAKDAVTPMLAEAEEEASVVAATPYEEMKHTASTTVVEETEDVDTPVVVADSPRTPSLLQQIRQTIGNRRAVSSPSKHSVQSSLADTAPESEHSVAISMHGMLETARDAAATPTSIEVRTMAESDQGYHGDDDDGDMYNDSLDDADLSQDVVEDDSPVVEEAPEEDAAPTSDVSKDDDEVQSQAASVKSLMEQDQAAPVAEMEAASDSSAPVKDEDQETPVAESAEKAATAEVDETSASLETSSVQSNNNVMEAQAKSPVLTDAAEVGVEDLGKELDAAPEDAAALEDAKAPAPNEEASAPAPNEEAKAPAPNEEEEASAPAPNEEAKAPAPNEEEEEANPDAAKDDILEVLDVLALSTSGKVDEAASGFEVTAKLCGFAEDLGPCAADYSAGPGSLERLSNIVVDTMTDACYEQSIERTFSMEAVETSAAAAVVSPEAVEQATTASPAPTERDAMPMTFERVNSETGSITRLEEYEEGIDTVELGVIAKEHKVVTEDGAEEKKPINSDGAVVEMEAEQSPEDATEDTTKETINDVPKLARIPIIRRLSFGKMGRSPSKDTQDAGDVESVASKASSVKKAAVEEKEDQTDTGSVASKASRSSRASRASRASSKATAAKKARLLAFKKKIKNPDRDSQDAKDSGSVVSKVLSTKETEMEKDEDAKESGSVVSKAPTASKKARLLAFKKKIKSPNTDSQDAEESGSVVSKVPSTKETEKEKDEDAKDNGSVVSKAPSTKKTEVEKDEDAKESASVVSKAPSTKTNAEKEKDEDAKESASVVSKAPSTKKNAEKEKDEDAKDTASVVSKAVSTKKTEDAKDTASVVSKAVSTKKTEDTKDIASVASSLPAEPAYQKMTGSINGNESTSGKQQIENEKEPKSVSEPPKVEHQKEQVADKESQSECASHNYSSRDGVFLQLKFGSTTESDVKVVTKSAEVDCDVSVLSEFSIETSLKHGSEEGPSDGNMVFFLPEKADFDKDVSPIATEKKGSKRFRSAAKGIKKFFAKKNGGRPPLPPKSPSASPSGFDCVAADAPDDVLAVQVTDTLAELKESSPTQEKLEVQEEDGGALVELPKKIAAEKDEDEPVQTGLSVEEQQKAAEPSVSDTQDDGDSEIEQCKDVEKSKPKLFSRIFSRREKRGDKDNRASDAADKAMEALPLKRALSLDRKADESRQSSRQPSPAKTRRWRSKVDPEKKGKSDKQVPREGTQNKSPTGSPKMDFDATVFKGQGLAVPVAVGTVAAATAAFHRRTRSEPIAVNTDNFVDDDADADANPEHDFTMLVESFR